jgi:hypothetical protein
MLTHFLRECKLVQLLQKTVQQYLLKLNIDPALALLGEHTKT